MSAQTTNPTASDTEAHVVDAPGMGGPSTEETVQADGADATVTEENSEGVSPEGQEPTGEEPEAKREPRDESRERYVADLEQRITDADAIARTIMADPERLRAYESWTKSDRGESGGEDSLTKTEAALAKWFKDSDEEPNQTALREVLSPVLSELRDLRKQVATMRPAVQKSLAAASSGEFQRALVDNGVPADAFKDRAFLSFLSAQRKDPDFARDERQRPGYAGKFLANAWRASRGQGAANAAARKRVEDMKGGRLHAAANPGGQSGRVLVIDDSKPGWDSQALAARTKDPSVRIEYRSSAAK